MIVHSFESLAARDGDGLRYAVFLAGCPLRCVCCHNPDTWSKENGRQYPVADILKKIIRYKPYMQAGNGGVTFSGGEPLLQAEELHTLIIALKNEDIGSCIDTSGCLPLTDAIKNALLSSESVMLDLKFANTDDYLKYTGGKLSNVLETLSFLTKNGIPTRIRTVIIPTINDSEEALREYAALLKPFREHITQWELLPFHTLGFAKYDALGIENPLQSLQALPHEKCSYLQSIANNMLNK